MGVRPTFFRTQRSFLLPVVGRFENQFLSLSARPTVSWYNANTEVTFLFIMRPSVSGGQIAGLDHPSARLFVRPYQSRIRALNSKRKKTKIVWTFDRAGVIGVPIFSSKCQKARSRALRNPSFCRSSRFARNKVFSTVA